MIVEILIFIITALIGYFIYIHKRVQSNFRERGLKFNPGYPIFGNVFGSSFQTKHLLDDIDAIYREFPDEKYVGYIEGTSPVILIRDPEIIKYTTVKDFDHFLNHKQFITEEVDPLFGGSLLMMRDEKWRNMRTILSPAFTGSKMRHMLPFMTEISNNIVEYLNDHISEDINVKDVVRRYANDVLASTAFGYQVNSVKDKDNEFYRTGQELFVKAFEQKFKLMLNFYFPSLAKLLGLTVFDKKFINFFKNVIAVTMEQREKNNFERPDMIQLLMQASKGMLKDDDKKDDAAEAETTSKQGPVRQWTDLDFACQLFTFYFAGFDTSSTALTMCIHELALNPKIQQRLYEEVKAYNDSKGSLVYDSLSDLKYLECVINETLRRWASAIIMDRVCTKPYELPPPREGGKPTKLVPGDVIYNVVNPIHLDPKHYPDPLVFDPDRFSDERKHEIKPFTYMPFGVGPRSCLGSRFALLELKVLLYQVILNFKILKCKKTTDPIVIIPHQFSLKAKGGTWVKLEKRS
ncbi:probable cytochrome P450 9f2 [Battus philenor]|uniref:probable cytochrome P450 9f2 n=1 Tax=Battus philenor TaxID=42288 RepID=UPI0035CFB5C3